MERVHSIIVRIILRLTGALVQNNLRGRHRMKAIALLEEPEEANSPSYFQWQEQTVRMPAVAPVERRAQPSSIVRLWRRIARKN